MATLQIGPTTTGTKPKYLRYWTSTGDGRDPHCRNSHHAHYVSYEELSSYEKPMRYMPEEEV